MSLWFIAVPLAALAIIIVIAIVAARTAAFKSKQTDAPSTITYPVDVKSAAARLAGAVTFKTVSGHDRSRFDYGQFSTSHAFLEKSFPPGHTPSWKSRLLTATAR